MKYKIFIDTNQLFNIGERAPLDEPFNLELSKLRDFLSVHKISNVDICIPEIVIQERVQQKLEVIDKTFKSVNDNIHRLLSLGHVVEKINPQENYRELLEKKVEKLMVDSGAVKIPSPKVDAEEIVSRAINKMPPFNDKGAGFKDTLIYLSIVEDALSDQGADAYIFCSEDKDFNDVVSNSFKTKTEKELYVIPSFFKLYEKLDELLPLGLHLEEKNRELRNLVMSHLGDLMHAVNKTIKKSSDTSALPPFSERGWSYYVDPKTYSFSSVFDETREPMAYDYDYFDLQSFEEITNGVYKVSASLTVTVRYEDEGSSSKGAYMDVTSVQSVYRPWSSRSDEKTFILQIKCDTNEHAISVLSVR